MVFLSLLKSYSIVCSSMCFTLMYTLVFVNDYSIVCCHQLVELLIL
jgi:hypothetical protein